MLFFTYRLVGTNCHYIPAADKVNDLPIAGFFD